MRRTARVVSVRLSTSLQYVTGAAAMTLVVNTPAVTASVSHVMSARSALGPFARIAAYMPEAAGEGGQDDARIEAQQGE